jgi:hypothetical protein
MCEGEGSSTRQCRILHAGVCTATSNVEIDHNKCDKKLSHESINDLSPPFEYIATNKQSRAGQSSPHYRSVISCITVHHQHARIISSKHSYESAHRVSANRANEAYATLAVGVRGLCYVAMLPTRPMLRGRRWAKTARARSQSHWT